MISILNLEKDVSPLVSSKLYTERQNRYDYISEMVGSVWVETDYSRFSEKSEAPIGTRT